MGRIRSIKPEFFFDEELAELPAQTRLFFIGLWNQADRRGRLEDRPSKLKAQILPYEKADADALLASLQPKFLVRYEVEGRKYIFIKAFEKHQRPHHTEVESCIPAYGGEVTVSSPLQDGENPPVLKEAVLKEKGKEIRVDDSSTPPNGLPSAEQVKEAFNRLCCPPLSKVVWLGTKRKQHVGARAKSLDELMKWEALFSRALKSSFLRGDVEPKAGQKPWRATFDWFVKNDENWAKVMEGQYDG